MNAVGEWVGREPPGRSAPRGDAAEIGAGSRGAERERSTCDCAKLRFCWGSESSTVPIRNVFARGPRGAGVGGGADAATVVEPVAVVAPRRVVTSLVVGGAV